VFRDAFCLASPTTTGKNLVVGAANAKAYPNTNNGGTIGKNLVVGAANAKAYPNTNKGGKLRQMLIVVQMAIALPSPAFCQAC